MIFTEVDFWVSLVANILVMGFLRESTSSGFFSPDPLLRGADDELHPSREIASEMAMIRFQLGYIGSLIAQVYPINRNWLMRMISTFLPTAKSNMALKRLF